MTGREDDDEREERERQQRERSKLSGVDGFYDRPPVRTLDDREDGRSKQRTGNVGSKTFRVHPLLLHKLEQLAKRDGIPSDVLLMKLLVEAYEKVTRPLDPKLLPSEAELIDRWQRKIDKQAEKPERRRRPRHDDDQ